MTSEKLCISALGPLEVHLGGHALAVERPAHRRLLSILSLHAGHRLATDVLIDRFWTDDPPETARAAIQTHISALRRILGDGHITTEGFGYLLDVPPGNLDVSRFERLALDTQRHTRNRDSQSALLAANRALELWRGGPFPNLEDDEFARPKLAKLEELHLELLEIRADSLISLGRAEEALPDLEALVIAHPYRERLWEHLMTARYRLGRHAEALSAFQHVSDHLAEIGVEPGGALRRLEESILFHDKSLTQTRNNLPAELDAFIGRSPELAKISKLLGESRLVTLSGPGGSGKTRLALQVARTQMERFPDGIWFVELANLDDPELIPAAIASALGVSGDEDLMPALENVLTARRALLIMDNCEHVAEETSDLVATLLGAAPDLSVLATSRQPLRSPGEQLFQVPGLALPDEGGDDEVVNSDAVRLFERRAQQADPTFVLEQEIDGVVAICRRLDAMPLGIELAAARVSSLGVAEIENHLDRSLGFLTAGAAAHPRHQTLEATIEWSYRLATDEAQRALAVLSVFRGGFDLDMAIWMLGTDAPRLLASLVDHSLVTTYQGAVGRRYRILETIRQFGAARAEDLSVSEQASRSHAEWCVSFSDHIWQSWQKPRFDQVEIAIHEEFENLTAAYERAEVTNDRVLAGRIAEGLLWHWDGSGHLGRALELFDEALETCADDDRRVGLLARSVWLRFHTNKIDQALADAETAYRLAQKLTPSEAKAYAVSTRAAIFGVRPDLDAADGIPYAREAVDIARETGNSLLVAVLELDLALALAWAGRTDEARSTLERAIELVERTGDPYTVAYTYYQATTVAMQVAGMRREGLADYSDRLLRWLDEHPHISSQFRMGWMEWAMIQRGDLVQVESLLRDWSAEDHLEGFIKLGNLVPLGVTVWMQGRLEEALRIIEECEAEGVNPRWYHDFIPLKVDVLTDMGRLDEAEAAGAVYLDYETDATESAKKLGVLNPLVRGAVELAMRTADHEALRSRAGSCLDQMERILAEHPPPMDGSVAMETHTTHLLFAKAELSRLDEASPVLWRAAMDAADFLYFRLYAQIRLGEAMLTTGEPEEGRQQVDAALIETQRIGATRLADLAEEVLSR